MVRLLTAMAVLMATAHAALGTKDCYFPSGITHGDYLRSVNATSALYQCDNKFVFTRSTVDGLATCEDGVIQLPVCVDDLCYGVRYDETRQPKYIDHGRQYSLTNYGSFNGYNSYDMYSCDKGYMLSAATSKMRHNGRLYGLASCDYGIVDLPVCGANRCPKDITNGYQDGQNEGYYNCTAGHQFKDPTVFKCGEGKAVEVPACEPIECWYPGTIEGGRVSTNGTDYADDDQVPYSCDQGWVMSENTSEATPCVNGTRDIPVCNKDACQRSSPYPYHIPNGRREQVYDRNQMHYRQDLYRCYSGYMLADNSTDDVAQYNGKIYGVVTCEYGLIITPSCVENRCNGSIPNGYQYDAGYYNCSEGYQFEDPSFTRCSEDGEEPTCDFVECWYPDNIEHGKMFDNRTEYTDDEPVYYYCNEGYTMHENSSDGTAVCENGTRDIPTCISDRCYDADFAYNITNGQLNTSTAERYYKGWHYEFRENCNSNYYYNYCKKIVNDYGYRAANDSDTVQYFCNKGYKLHDNSSDGLAWCNDHVISFPTCVHELDVKLARKGIGHEVKVSFDNTTWGSVCDDDWSDREAQVVCRSIGYQGGQAVSMRGKSTIMLSNFDCVGNEQSLGLCGYSRYPSPETLPCKHNELAGVRCYHKEWIFQPLIKKATVNTRKLIHIVSVHFKMLVKKFDISYEVGEYLAPTFYGPNMTQQYSAQVKYNNKSGLYKAKLGVNGFEQDEHCLTMVVTMAVFERYSETQFCLKSEGNGTVALSVHQ